MSVTAERAVRMAGLTRLNLGCGKDIREDFINIDIRDEPGVDIVADVRLLATWPTYTGYPVFNVGTMDEILAYDLLEHIPPADVPQTLTLWRQLLKTGGKLHLRIPDIRKIARRMLSGSLPEDEAIRLLYGDQSPEWGGTEWGSHKWGYTDDQIANLLAKYDLWLTVVLSPNDEHALYIEAIAGRPNVGGPPA